MMTFIESLRHGGALHGPPYLIFPNPGPGCWAYASSQVRTLKFRGGIICSDPCGAGICLGVLLLVPRAPPPSPSQNWELQPWEALVTILTHLAYSMPPRPQSRLTAPREPENSILQTKRTLCAHSGLPQKVSSCSHAR